MTSQESRVRVSRRGLLGAVTVGGVAAALPARAIADSGGGASNAQYRFDVVRLVFWLTRPAVADHQVSVLRTNQPEVSVGVLAAGSRQAQFTVNRSLLSRDGSLILNVAGAHSSRLQGWAHLMAQPTDASVSPPQDSTTLRSHSLAYASLTDLDEYDNIDLGITSHTVDGNVTRAGELSEIVLDGEVLSGANAMTVVPGSLTTVSVQTTGSRTTVDWLHAAVNPLRLILDRDSDRLRYTYTYRVVGALDQAVPVTTQFGLPGSFATLDSLNWWYKTRADHSTRFDSDPHPGDQPLPLSQYPFVAARSAAGVYIGIIDYAGSSLFARVNEAEDTLGVEMWMWPRRRGQTYTWTFETTVGYEQYPNAFLRAYYPHTIHNTSNVLGAAMGPTVPVTNVEEAKSYFDLGIRSEIYQYWYYRNGLYFDPSQPFGQLYTTISGTTFSYAKLEEQKRIFDAAGIEFYVYFQFAGVSQDVQGKFESCLVRNPQGDLVVAGKDQGIPNILANPDPERAYGSSLLQQVDELLRTVKPDGIFLDRADRLDFAYDNDYDYGSFDGYSSPRLPDAAPMPSSSLTHGGVALLQELRRIADSHGAKLMMNLPTAVPAMTYSDSTFLDQATTPWALFFIRASTNGKPLTLINRTDPGPQRTADNKLMAELAGAHPHFFRDQGKVPLTPAEMRRDPRLQYVIPTDDPYPAYWLFDDGASVFRYDSTASTVPTQFSGSTFIPLSP